jgi:hypothetical protein
VHLSLGIKLKLDKQSTRDRQLASIIRPSEGNVETLSHRNGLVLLQESLRVQHSSHIEEKRFYAAAESGREFPSLPIRLILRLRLSWLGPQHRHRILEVQ